ncbi:hypothetical protein [Streptomyces litchfieldiae]|uniref:Uncharacterized protein n=1 Tax=Streptomyces litchfieldiae TaxID=3075543 RepID=A0ABU2MMA4_9ACTN|nr:hypothetical protein [Streptomyces sp. DSM 44938]MDT0342552.1 hypothetical protein [Streptomyces sp. DSM 44938]
MTPEADRAALAQFCALLPRLRRMVGGPASAARRALVEQVVEAARRGAPIGDELARLGLSADPPGSPDDGHRAAPLPPPVEAARRPVTGVYLCPASACPRAEVRAAGEALPTCDVHERALRFVADG